MSQGLYPAGVTNRSQLNNPNLLRLRTIWLAIGSSPPTWQTPALVGLGAAGSGPEWRS